jgi:heptosyltransferase-1
VKILFVRLRQIGDVVFTTPAIHAVRDRFPDAHLTYLVEPAAAPVVQANPWLHRVIVAPRRPGLRGLRDDLQLGRELRRERFDLVIDFHGGPRASLLTWLTRAPRRLGYEITGRGWMYTTQVPRPRALRARHSVENQWDLLTPLGIAAPSRDGYPVEMTPSPQAAVALRQRAGLASAAAGEQLVVMHVSAGNPFRRWPLESFAEVAAALASRMAPTTVIVTSGPSELDAAARVVGAARERLLPGAAGRIVACDLSLPELRALVDTAVLYIGGDSGPMHVAATSRVPMVSLYGPTLPARSAPWRPAAVPALAVEQHGLPCRPCDQRVCEPGDFRCLGLSTPAQVLDAAERLLAGQTG